jgi:hypothetical protein
LGDERRFLDKEHATNDFFILLSDPATFPLWVKAFHEVGDYSRDQCLEFFIPSVFLCVERAVTVNNSTHIASARSPQ